MKQALKSLMHGTRGAIDITSVVVDVALVVALIPVIKTFVSDATNLSATETLLLGLTTLFIIIALVVAIVRQAGFGHKR